MPLVMPKKNNRPRMNYTCSELLESRQNFEAISPPKGHISSLGREELKCNKFPIPI
jgi:hypothetical protein